MSQENMWKIGHPELDISTVEIISIEPVYKHQRNVSRKFEKYISSRTGDNQR